MVRGWSPGQKGEGNMSYTDKIAVTPEGVCSFCSKSPESPFTVMVDGEIHNCCVGNAHDAHVEPGSKHEAWVANARAAGIDGRW